MSNPLDDYLDDVSKGVEDHLKKSARKRETKKSRTVEYTTPDGEGEGEAIVETSHDGERHFVVISEDDPYMGSKRIVSVDDDSLGGVLTKAEEAFKEAGYGSISLEWLADE